jgi:DNA polymerase-3 subunit delta'
MVSLPPYEGKYKVFIIDGAEGLSDEAANCLLKTLEEPPPKAVLILLAARERLLLPTLISRCQRLELFPLSVSCIEKVLIERSGVAPPRAELLARLSGGCLGWALCLQRDEGLLEKRSNELDTLAKLIGAGREHRLAYAASLASLSSRNREQVEEMLTLWIEWWRDMLLVKGSAESFITNIDRHSTLSYQAKGYSLKQIQVYLGMIRGALEQLNQNANPRLVLEVLMLRMPYPETMANN